MKLRRVPFIGWIGAAYFLVYALWLGFGLGGPDTIVWVSDLGSLGAEALAIGCVVVAAVSSSGRQRIAWIALAAALASWFTGDAIWAIYELALDVEVPFPSPSDIGYLFYYVRTIVVLVALPTGNAGATLARLFLDGLLVAGSLFVLAWAAAKLRRLREFAVLFEGGEEPALSAAERILEAFDAEFLVDEQPVDVRPSAPAPVGWRYSPRR